MSSLMVFSYTQTKLKGGSVLYNMDISSIPPEVELIAVKYRKKLYKYLDKSSIRKVSKDKANECLRLFLYNCIVASKCHNTFAMSLREETYSKSPIRNGRSLRKKCSFTYTKKVLDFFTELGLISYEKGGIDEWNSREDFTTKPTIVTVSHTIADQCNSIEISEKTHLQINCLILRDSDKNDIKFSQGVYQKEKIVMLNKYNLRAIKTEITKDKKTGNYLLQLRKIYNEDFAHGGRLYDLSVQSMSKKERKLLKINGENVRLLDYKSFETSIAYTLCDTKMQGDPYTIDFEEYHPDIVRTVCKLIMTRIYNCNNKKTLSYLVNEYIHDNFDLEKLLEEGKIPEKRIPVGLFIDILEDKHDAISEMFYNRSGDNLQYIGSEIMDYVIEKVMQNHLEVVIPVFDEVVCPESIVDRVECYMKDAFDSVLEDSTNCKIDID